MRKIALLILVVLKTLLGSSQTTLFLKETLGAKKIWNVISAGDTVAEAYDFNSAQIVFYPQIIRLAGTTTFTGTYTSSDGQLAGTAYENGNEVRSNKNDPFNKKSNAYLSGSAGTLSLENHPTSTCIPVYQILNDGVETSVVKNLSKTSTFWRCFVVKTITRKGVVSKSTIIVDFEKSTTLEMVCEYLKGMERNNSNYSSTIDACLLDTGYYRTFILNGNLREGTFFPNNQSNVIVVE